MRGEENVKRVWKVTRGRRRRVANATGRICMGPGREVFWWVLTVLSLVQLIGIVIVSFCHVIYHLLVSKLVLALNYQSAPFLSSMAQLFYLFIYFLLAAVWGENDSGAHCCR